MRIALLIECSDQIRNIFTEICRRNFLLHHLKPNQGSCSRPGSRRGFIMSDTKTTYKTFYNQHFVSLPRGRTLKRLIQVSGKVAYGLACRLPIAIPHSNQDGVRI